MVNGGGSSGCGDWLGEVGDGEGDVYVFVLSVDGGALAEALLEKHKG